MKNAKRKTKTQSLKLLALSFIFALFVLRFSLVCAQEPIKSIDLITNAKYYDGKIVVFEGEAIGNIMNRGNFAWINVTQNDNAIGIWLTKDLARQIKFVGGYKKKGDRLRVEGMFNRACLEHGGDLDIHATKLVIVRSGSKLEDVVSSRKKELVYYLGGIVLCLLMLRLYLSRQKKK